MSNVIVTQQNTDISADSFTPEELINLAKVNFIESLRAKQKDLSVQIEEIETKRKEFNKKALTLSLGVVKGEYLRNEIKRMIGEAVDEKFDEFIEEYESEEEDYDDMPSILHCENCKVELRSYDLLEVRDIQRKLDEITISSPEIVSLIEDAEKLEQTKSKARRKIRDLNDQIARCSSAEFSDKIRAKMTEIKIKNKDGDKLSAAELAAQVMSETETLSLTMS